MIELVPSPDPRGINVAVLSLKPPPSSRSSRVTGIAGSASAGTRPFSTSAAFCSANGSAGLAYVSSSPTVFGSIVVPMSWLSRINFGSLSGMISATMGYLPRSVIAAFNTVPPCSRL
jgi:hypothetical protein